MATDKANYKGGKGGNLLEGLKTHSPPVKDKSRDEIGTCYRTSVNDKLRGNEVGEAKPATIGPRTA